VGLAPNPSADKAKLLRRLSLDLTGLPPDSMIAQQFLQDTSQQAYPYLVDTLLSLPSFGEHWASMWLDLARYADSKGYEKDLNRQIWPYRDWVIQALNEDMSFDQFTIEQLAGDLLPSPSESQLIATGFLRNSMANDEGGTDDEEFRVAAQIERVGTSWEVWMGTTMACVQCHSHPYDPIRMEDFYSFMAYLDNTVDNDLYNEQPKLYRYADSSREAVQEKIDWVMNQTEAAVQLPDTFFHPQTQSLLWQLGFRRIEGEEYQAHSELIELNSPQQEAVSQIQDSSWIMYRNIPLDNIQQLQLQYTSPHSGGYLDLYLDELYGQYLGSLRLGNTGGWREPALVSIDLGPLRGTHDLYFHFRMAQDFNNELLRLDWWQLIPEESAYTMGSQAFRDSLEAIYQETAQVSLILQELQGEERRQTFLFDRGNWLNPEQVVQASLPAIMGSQPPEDRLAMAKWMVSAENPLTARVIVNRFWQQLFGQGLVNTPEDFGTQGNKPSHPALLDWLAVEFQTTYAWSMKHLLREIVLSETYQQSSQTDSLRLALDPSNRLLSRSARVRLSAEQIRDQALAASGLLKPQMFGPPVRVEAPVPNDPYRQGNLIDFNPYRRSIYSFLKRTYPVPFQITFDSPQRNICTSRRINTNTPLQALSLLNDSLMFRAAQHMAGPFTQGAAKENIRAAYEFLFYHSPKEQKLDALFQLYQSALKRYRQQPALLEEWPDEGFGNSPKHAAMSLTMNAMMNLDEWISKP
ncbi:MAG: DUF1553 domain-containing protein, partial [Bacteroidota bacterium]